MKSVNQQIAHLLSKYPSIQKCMKRDIINVRSLARFLKEKYQLPYTMDALISSIRRYDLDDVTIITSKEADEALSKVLISIKDNVAKIRLKDIAFKEICNDYIKEQILKKNTRLVKSKEIITLIVNQKDLEQKKSVFKEEDIMEIKKNLAEIRLQFSKDISNIKGILSRIIGELAIRDINLEEVIYGIPTLLIYVKEDSVVQAHHALMEMKR
jgi:hypothetical protein